METSDFSLTIVIPCFNEEANLPFLIQELQEEILKERFKVKLVDNGSTDRTLATLEKILTSLPEEISKSISVIHLPKNLNYGGGIKAGIQECKTDYVGWFHADLQFSASEISKLVTGLEPGVILVKGIRKSRPLIERAFTCGMSIVASVIFRCRLHDINGQPTLYRKEFLEQFPTSPNDFSFDAFFYINAVKKGCEISRFRVLMRPRMHGISSWNNGLRSQIGFSIRTLKSLWKMRAAIHA